MTLRVWRYGPGHEMAYHRHRDQEEVYQLVSGGPQEVFVEGETVSVQDGDWLRVPTGHAAADPEPHRPRGRVAHDRRAPRRGHHATASASTRRRARRSPAREPAPWDARLLALAALLARKQGAAVARLLLAARPGLDGRPGQRAPPRQALESQLTVGRPQKAGGAAGRLSAGWPGRSSAGEVSVRPAWERDLMALRYEIADMAPGPCARRRPRRLLRPGPAGAHLIATPAAAPTRRAADVLRGARGRGADAGAASGCPPTSGAGPSTPVAARPGACAGARATLASR